MVIDCFGRKQHHEIQIYDPAGHTFMDIDIPTTGGSSELGRS
jgi:hypothetical protein